MRRRGAAAFFGHRQGKLRTVQVDTCTVREKKYPNTGIPCTCGTGLGSFSTFALTTRTQISKKKFCINRLITGKPINHVTDFPGGDHRPKSRFSLHSYSYIAVYSSDRMSMHSVKMTTPSRSTQYISKILSYRHFLILVTKS